MTDPRFDPLFQRGYSGPEPELAVREQAAPTRAPIERAAPGERAAPVGQDEAAASQRSDPAHDPEQRGEARVSPRNLSRLALLLFGLVLLIAAASTLSSQVQNPQGTSTTVESQFVQGLVSTLPPVFALTGLVCLILWLALGALDHVGSGSDQTEN